jgi:hypothetical protein
MQNAIDTDELTSRFTYHAPKEDQPARYEAIRAKALELALLIAKTTPYSREQSTSLTHLDTCVFNANAAIARRE